MATQTLGKTVYRSRDASIGGVCAGLAARYDLDPIVVRILAIFIVLLTAGLGLIVYFVLWARLPRETEPDVPYEIRPASAESSSFGSVDCDTGRAVSRSQSKRSGSISLLARLAIAVGLTLLFLAVSMAISPLLPGTEWWQFWPVALIIAGLCLIVIPIPTRFEAAWHALGIVTVSVAVLLLPISLDVLSWGTIPLAFSRGWVFFVLAAIMFIIGAYRGINGLMVGSAFFIVAFCVFALTMCAVPGDAGVLVIQMPDGQFLEIGFSGN